MTTENADLKRLADEDYKYGFVSDIEADQLPLKYATVSTCFRREAGAAGKDTAGLYRIHQFDKVEQVVVCRADEAESRAHHAAMIGIVEELLQALELPYRLLQCCTGDLGMKNADTETGNLREDFQKSLESLNLECSPSIAKDRAGAHGDEYFVIHRGRKCLLENHIKKGTSREPRKCLRIYFFWDAEEQVVVVGSLPGHLDTQAT